MKACEKPPAVSTWKGGRITTEYDVNFTNGPLMSTATAHELYLPKQWRATQFMCRSTPQWLMSLRSFMPIMERYVPEKKNSWWWIHDRVLLLESSAHMNGHQLCHSSQKPRILTPGCDGGMQMSLLPKHAWKCHLPHSFMTRHLGLSPNSRRAFIKHIRGS